MPAEPPRDAGAPAAPQGRRFGVRAGGVALLLPETVLEHVAAASVFPLPGAGRGVLGLAQLRGHPVVVLDPTPDRAAERRAPARRHALLVIGMPPDVGALAVDAPPVPVRLGARRADAPRPDAPFAAALDEAFEDAGDPSTLWWRFEPQRLFELLAA